MRSGKKEGKEKTCVKTGVGRSGRSWIQGEKKEKTERGLVLGKK